MKIPGTKNKEQLCYWSKNAEKITECQAAFSKTSYFTAKISIDKYENCFYATSTEKIVPPGMPPKRIKGDIQLFSKNSRSRLIKLFSTISLSDYYKMVFVTLTFHEDYPKEAKSLKQFLDLYLKRLNRLFPNVDWLWRFELQERGAPHFHFILLLRNSMKGIQLEKIRLQTRKAFFAIKECSCNHCLNYGFRFDELETAEKAFLYISKYCAKINEQILPQYSGRKWGYKRSTSRRLLERTTLYCYQFIYFKKLLFDHYRTIKGKADYIGANIKSVFSWFLLCSVDVYDNLLDKVLGTDLRTIFERLQYAKILDSNLVLDSNNIAIHNHLNGNKFLFNN